jgi:hypothetical protein
MILDIYDVAPTLKHSDDKTDPDRLKKAKIKAPATSKHYRQNDLNYLMGQRVF